MAPPKFSDIGSLANGLFNDHHNSGKNSLTKSGKTGGGTYEINIENEHGSDQLTWNCNVNGDGLSFSMDHENTMSHSLDITIAQVKNLALCWDASFHPENGLNLGTVNANYTTDKVNANLNAGINASPTLAFDATFSKGEGHCPMTFGIAANVDTKSMGVSDQKFAAQISGSTLELSYVSDNLNNLSGTYSLYKKLENNKNFCCYGVQSTSNGTLALAAASECGDNTIRYKVDQTGEFSVGRVSRLNMGAKLNLSAAFNLANLQAGGHKFGVGLSFE